MLEKALIQSDSRKWTEKLTGKPSLQYALTEVQSGINVRYVQSVIDEQARIDGVIDFAYGEYIFSIEYDCINGACEYFMPQLNLGTGEKNYCMWYAEEFNRRCQPDQICL